MEINNTGIEFYNPMKYNTRDGESEAERNSNQSLKVVTKKDDTYRDIVIFDTIQTQFHVDVFFFQLFIHLFALFSVFSPNPSAQGFGLKCGVDLYYNWGLSFILYLMIASYFLSPKDDFVVLSGALWIPLIYFLQHKLVVAIKYGSLSPSEYRRFMDCTDPALSLQYRNQMQLIAAWLNRDESVLEFELGAAAIRVGSKLSEVKFLLPDPKKSVSNRSQWLFWHAFLRGRGFVDESVQDTDGIEVRSDGRYNISVFNLVTALVRRCDSQNFGESLCFYVIYSFCVVTIIIPFILLATNNNNTSAMDSMWVMTFYMTSTTINLSFGPLVYNLLYVAIFDVLRQLRMVDELTAMIRISDLTLHPDRGPDYELAATFSDRMSLSTGEESHSPSRDIKDNAVTDNSTGFAENSIDNAANDYTASEEEGQFTPSFSTSSAIVPLTTSSRLSTAAVGSVARMRSEKNGEAIYKLNRPQSVSISHFHMHNNTTNYPLNSAYQHTERNISTNSSNSTLRYSISTGRNSSRPSGAAYIRDLSSMHRIHRPASTASSLKCPITSVSLDGRFHQDLQHSSSDMERASVASSATRNSISSSFCSISIDPLLSNRYTEIGEKVAENGGRAEIPRISFDQVDNILAWTYARLALQNFGDRFRFRIDLYVGGTIALMVILVAVSMAVVFSFKDRSQAFHSSFLLQSLTTVNLIYWFLITITYLGGLMNEKYRDQKQLLTRHCMRQRMKWLQASQLVEDRETFLRGQYKQYKKQFYKAQKEAHKSETAKFQNKHNSSMKEGHEKGTMNNNDHDNNITEDIVEEGELLSREEFIENDKFHQFHCHERIEIQETLEQLESFMDILDAENEWKPFKIFGIEASSSLTMTVLSSYVSFLGLVLMLFSRFSYIGTDLMGV